MYAMTLQRFQIIMMLAVSLAFLYYTTDALNWKTVLPVTVITIIFFFLIPTFRAGKLFIYYIYQNSEMRFPISYAMFTEPYMYIAMNLENFARGVHHLDQYTFGYYTFDFVTALVGLKHWLGEYFALVETPYLISGYNTYSTFWWFYRDFGALGTAFIPLGLGLAIGKIYYSMRQNPTLGIVIVYSVCVVVMLFSFFNNVISFLWFFYNVVGLAIGYRFIMMKTVKA
jgi:oligosaccharide repeat unit polymerase